MVVLGVGGVAGVYISTTGPMKRMTGPLCLVTVMIGQKIKYLFGHLSSPLMSPNMAVPVGHFISKEAKREGRKNTNWGVSI